MILRGGNSGGGGGPYGAGGRKAGEPPRNIIYVLDLSKSMKPRVDRAAEELKSALRELQPGETFSMIALSNAARRFKKQLVPANPKNIADANKWLDEAQLDFGTDLGKAINQAFSMRGVNVIVLITDGVPTMGETNFAKLAARIRKVNGNRARIDTIRLKGDNAMDADGNPQDKEAAASELLEQIARESGGEFKIVPD